MLRAGASISNIDIDRRAGAARKATSASPLEVLRAE
jgi:hypothetical protein